MANAITTDAGILRIIELLETDIKYIGIGTGTFSGESATLLDNETDRKPVTASSVDNVLILDGYWDETEGNGVTYLESGCFCDGATASIDSGTLFAGSTISVIKDSTQSLTISVEITVEAVNA